MEIIHQLLPPPAAHRHQAHLHRCPHPLAHHHPWHPQPHQAAVVCHRSPLQPLHHNRHPTAERPPLIPTQLDHHLRTTHRHSLQVDFRAARLVADIHLRPLAILVDIHPHQVVTQVMARRRQAHRFIHPPGPPQGYPPHSYSGGYPPAPGGYPPPPGGGYLPQSGYGGYGGYPPSGGGYYRPPAGPPHMSQAGPPGGYPGYPGGYGGSGGPPQGGPPPPGGPGGPPPVSQ